MRSLRLFCLLVWVIVAVLALDAQTAPDTSTDAALRSMAARATVVFAGEVTSVQPEAGAQVITFRVDSAMKGPLGAAYTLREWPGLWAGGSRRFYAGQRAVFFLYAASPAQGFGGPVDGLDGVIPLMATGGAFGADLRRIATRVWRPRGAPLTTSRTATLNHIAKNVRAELPLPERNWRLPVRRLPVRAGSPQGDADALP